MWKTPRPEPDPTPAKSRCVCKCPHWFLSHFFQTLCWYWANITSFIFSVDQEYMTTLIMLEKLSVAITDEDYLRFIWWFVLEEAFCVNQFWLHLHFKIKKWFEAINMQDVSSRTCIMLAACNINLNSDRLIVDGIVMLWGLQMCNIECYLHGYTVHQWYQTFSSPTNAHVEFIKTI